MMSSKAHPAHLVACPLHQRRGSLEKVQKDQVFSECRCCWCYGQVLKAVTDTICTRIQIPTYNITFVRVGEKPQAELRESLGSWRLTSGSSWSFQISLQGGPSGSDCLNHMLLLELTVFWEDHSEKFNESKNAKYLKLLKEHSRQWWKAWSKLSEGFTGYSLHRTLYIRGLR